MEIDAVAVEPDETARRIREWLRDHPEVCHGDYHAERGRVAGHCYAATEAYYHSIDRDLDVYCLSHDTGTHWFCTDDTTVVDLSIETVERAKQIPHSKATRRAFLTGYDTPSKRTQRVLDGI